MDREEQRQVEQLVAAIIDDGATAERVAGLEALLRDRADLQDHYARLIGVQLLLTQELNFSTAALAPAPQGVVSTQGLPGLGPVTSSIPLEQQSGAAGVGTPAPDQTRKTRWAARAGAWIAIAATLLAAVWLGPQAVGFVTGEDTDVPQRLTDASGAEGLLIRDSRVLDRLVDINRIARPRSLTLPVGVAGTSPEITLCSGAAWMEYSPHHRERGYLLALPPGVKMDIGVDANALCHNSLSVVQLGASGRLTGRTLTFTNLVEGDLETLEHYADSIGRYSELNEGPMTDYYLFTGAHKYVERADAEPWQPSDYRVHFSTEDLLVIGWDDSGHGGKEPLNRGSENPDRDYDDIRAVFRFSGAGIPRPAAGLTFAPQPLRIEPVESEAPESGGYAEFDESDFVLSVPPGEEALLLLSSEASLPNTLRVIDRSEGRVVWRYETYGEEPALTDTSGAFLIRNHGEIVKQFVLEVRPQTQGAAQSDRSRKLPQKIVVDDRRLLSVGFEDNLAGEPTPDWNDLRVDIHRFSDED